jgi:hypothetical protein
VEAGEVGGVVQAAGDVPEQVRCEVGPPWRREAARRSRRHVRANNLQLKSNQTRALASSVHVWANQGQWRRRGEDIIARLSI